MFLFALSPTSKCHCFSLALTGEEFDQMPENHIYLKIKRLKELINE